MGSASWFLGRVSSAAAFCEKIIIDYPWQLSNSSPEFISRAAGALRGAVSKYRFYLCFPRLSAAGAGQEAVPEPGWRDEDVQRETEIASKGDVARLPSPEPHVREYR